MNSAQLVTVFFSNPEDVQVEEKVESVLITAKSSQLNEIDADALAKIINAFPDRDKFILTLRVGSTDPNPIKLNNHAAPDIDTFIAGAKKSFSTREDGDQLFLKVEVTKNKEADIISIYSLPAFSEHLSTLGLRSVLDIFRGHLSLTQHSLSFALLNESNTFATKSISFDRAVRPVDERTLKLRKDRLDKLKLAGHFGNSSTYEFIPDDFFMPANPGNEKLKGVFDKISLLLMIVYLFDITEIRDDDMYYKLNGYKSISGILSYDNLPIQSANEYYGIYDWVYDGGNLSDKIGLARNIISLHLDSVAVLALKDNPFVSIKSAYELYLKDNLRQYVEIRNKITDQLRDFSDKASKIVEDFTGNFQKSIFAFISFFASLVVLKVLSNGGGEFLNIMTREAAILSDAFLCIPIIYLLYSMRELKTQKRRFIKAYFSMKIRYRDLLNKKDIDRILRKDIDFRRDVQYISEKRNWYIGLWIILIGIFAFSILILRLMYKPPTLFP